MNMSQLIPIFLLFEFVQTAFGQVETFEGLIKYQTITTSYIEHQDTIQVLTDHSYSFIYHKNGNFAEIPSENKKDSKQIFLKDSCKISLALRYG